MKTVEILSLPSVRFAHVFDAPQYHTQFFIREGQIEVAYLYKGGFFAFCGEKEVRLEEGDLIVALYDEERYIRADSYHCHHTVAAQMDLRIGEDLPDGLLLPLRTPAEIVPQEAYRLIDELIRLHNMQQQDSTRGRTKFMELLCLIDDCNRKARYGQIPNGVYLAAKAKTYISEHIREPITQQEIAARLGITPGYLCDLFKEAQGEPLMRYVNRIKLRNVRSLMENEAISLREASAVFGYADPNYVSRLYKQLFGQNITFHL